MVEPQSDDLQAKIISTAKAQTDFQSISIWEYLDEIFKSFHIPAPALALSLLLLGGITLGYLYDDLPNGQQDEVALNDFLYYEGEYYE